MTAQIGRRPDIVEKLRAELDTVMHDSMDVPDIAVLQSLPYLNAFLKEGERGGNDIVFKNPR